MLRDPTLVRHLFGHVRGAFTGAGSTSDGVVAVADGGTLYLDEIADLLPEAQACLVRVLESGEYRPLGAANARHTDVRIVSSTAADISALVRSGHFRGDLYYRLRGAMIDIPPLRRRREDIARVALDELRSASRASDATIGAPTALTPAGIELPRDVEAALVAHDWPGNTRELRQEIQQAIALCRPGPIHTDILQFPHDPPPVAPRRPLSARPGLRSRIGEFEAQAVREALGEAGGNKAEAARRLGITRRTLYRRLAQMRGESDS